MKIPAPRADRREPLPIFRCPGFLLVPSLAPLPPWPEELARSELSMAPLASAAPPTARLMQRCGGGYRELPSSLFEELEQSHRTIDELRRQLEQALTAERSLVQQRSEKEGSAAHALVQAQLAFADKVALWNERLQEGAVQQQEATQLLAASQRQVAELQAPFPRTHRTV